MILNPRSNFNNSCFSTDRQQQQQPQQQMYCTDPNTNPSMDPTSSGSNDHYNSLLYNLSVLKEKFHQTQALVMAMPRQQSEDSTCASLSSLTTSIQELVVAASSMIFTCQQMAITTQFQPQPTTSLYDNWYEEEYNVNCPKKVELRGEASKKSVIGNGYDIVELNVAELLAKYTHYCHVCGKGFKRDANLRMHMRAHGDEYKSAAALSNPMKSSNETERCAARKYSCPQEGCRWNRKHDKFQPLKSMICAKNHYKRSHCPKMYVCKRCGRKQFSVLSDLRTHEKHCGDLKWMCSCGTTFSRKDKLMGHVGLFVGHSPVTSHGTTAADRKRVKSGPSSSFTN